MKCTWTRVCMAGAMVFVFGSVSWTSFAQAPKSVRDGVYTDAQAKRGQAVYDAQCSACHGEKLAGALAPPLTGASFLGAWDKLPLSDLVDKIKNTMPASSPGSLKPGEVTDVVALILQSSGFPAGAQELTAGDALKQVAIVASTAPAASTAASPSTKAPAALLSGLPAGNMAQVMRGILFPSSNMIFNVQSYDPGAPKAAYEPGKAGFSWADWGAGIYSGWEMVDYAAISLAESAPLLLTPGRRCENGRPVPVENADWIKFTQELVEAGKAAYRASQTRNQDAVSEATNQVADACLNCHVVYRDKPGGNEKDPSNKAARCVR
jgi:S-disulfanyl-L-cysteine oxidoreductase SoxD